MRDDADIPSGVFDAVRTADAAYWRLASASSLYGAAVALEELADAMSDLISWHPEYDPERGEIPAGD